MTNHLGTAELRTACAAPAARIAPLSVRYFRRNSKALLGKCRDRGTSPNSIACRSASPNSVESKGSPKLLLNAGAIGLLRHGMLMSALPAEVYQGIYGPWQIEQEDLWEVWGYRGALSTAAAGAKCSCVPKSGTSTNTILLTDPEALQQQLRSPSKYMFVCLSIKPSCSNGCYVNFSSCAMAR
jgi:hypothetical protein